jgi:hypothetical protein
MYEISDLLLHIYKRKRSQQKKNNNKQESKQKENATNTTFDYTIVILLSGIENKEREYLSDIKKRDQ